MGLGVYSTRPSRMANLRGSVLSSLVLFVLTRTPNHDVAVVIMVRTELSSHLVGLPRGVVHGEGGLPIRGGRRH